MKGVRVIGHLDFIAATYMLRMGIDKTIIRSFQKNGRVYLFENGVAKELEPDNELSFIIRNIEEASGVKVYGVTHDYMICGEMYSYLCVSPYSDDWSLMISKHGDTMFSAYAYVQNLDADICSEFGSVLLNVINGRPSRVG